MKHDPATHKAAQAMRYLRFLRRSLIASTDGSWHFYVWMIMLTAIALVGVNAWAQQVVLGLATTNLTDHVSWGLYIANFTFMVGLAAGGVMMVIPAYIYRDHDMHDITIIGELLAIAAIVMALLFVVVDMGRPDRLWHMIPGLGRFNWPISMLTWDVLVLNGYLLLNLHVAGYLVYQRYLGKPPNPRWYVPFVLLSIVWAISIHTVTAFLYAGLGGRPFWNSALLAPRFLTSAFISGPAFIIITLQVIQRLTPYRLPEAPIRTLVQVVRITTIVNLFMVASELFTELYAGGSHTASTRYLFFGMHGHHELVPWIWTAVALNVSASFMLWRPGVHRAPAWMSTALVMTFVGVWIEKGMGLIVPGFIPSTLHEIVPYTPSLNEWKVSAGIWAFGLMVYTVAIKLALEAFSGDLRWSKRPPRAHHDGGMFRASSYAPKGDTSDAG